MRFFSPVIPAVLVLFILGMLVMPTTAEASSAIALTPITWHRTWKTVCVPYRRNNCYSHEYVYQCYNVVRGPNGVFAILINSYADDCSMHRRLAYSVVHDGARLHIYTTTTYPDGSSSQVEIATSAFWWAEVAYERQSCLSTGVPYCP